jgi:Virulence factor BrkB
MRPRDLPQLLKEAAFEWIEDGAMRLSSSLAYYAIFSLAPLLVIVISIAGLVFGEEAARGQIAQQISALAGAHAGEAIQATVQASASEKTTGVLATIIGLVVLLFGASTVFAELNDLGRHGQAGPRVFHARARPFSFVLNRARDWLSSPCLARAQCGARRARQIYERPAAAPRRRVAGVRFSRLVCGHQRALRDDFQNAAKRAHRLARRVDRRGGHGAAFHHRQVPHRPLSRHQQHRFELRRGRLGGDRARMDLLLVVHPVFRRGVHESLRSQIRLRHRAEQSCGARERFAASKTLVGANAAITKATR